MFAILSCNSRQRGCVLFTPLADECYNVREVVTPGIEDGAAVITLASLIPSQHVGDGESNLLQRKLWLYIPSPPDVIRWQRCSKSDV